VLYISSGIWGLPEEGHSLAAHEGIHITSSELFKIWRSNISWLTACSLWPSFHTSRRDQERSWRQVESVVTWKCFFSLHWLSSMP